MRLPDGTGNEVSLRPQSASWTEDPSPSHYEFRFGCRVPYPALKATEAPRQYTEFPNVRRRG